MYGYPLTSNEVQTATGRTDIVSVELRVHVPVVSGAKEAPVGDFKTYDRALAAEQRRDTAGADGPGRAGWGSGYQWIPDYTGELCPGMQPQVAGVRIRLSGVCGTDVEVVMWIRMRAFHWTLYHQARELTRKY